MKRKSGLFRPPPFSLIAHSHEPGGYLAVPGGLMAGSQRGPGAPCVLSEATPIYVAVARIDGLKHRGGALATAWKTS